MGDKDEKLCPMTFANPADISMKCERERCAWWYEDKQKCAIAVREGKK